MVECLEGEDLSARRQQLFHVLAANAKSASRDARDDLKLLPPVGQRADGAEMLATRRPTKPA